MVGALATMAWMNEIFRQELEVILGVAVSDIRPLGGGSIGEVYRVKLVDNTVIVAKVDKGKLPQLALEGYMLRYLAENSRLPVPAVLHSSDRLLLLEYLPGESRFSAGAQQQAAELLAGLHNISAAAYGFERDTLIGGLHQPNPWTTSWLAFFREQRLIYMGEEARRAGRLPGEIMARLERFCGRLDRWLAEPERPSLIHGDAWTGNVLAVGNRISGFLDPALYFADAEIELAFTTLFGTFGRPFFERYEEARPLRPGFFEERRDIYNLYPLLVHVRLFGGGYLQSVSQVLAQFGF